MKFVKYAGVFFAVLVLWPAVRIGEIFNLEVYVDAACR
jgi:hypothetical protein